MNGARFVLSDEHLSGSDCALNDTNPWSLHHTTNLGLKRLRCVIGELVDTEESYVQSLCDVDQGYLAQLVQDPDVEPDVLNTVFGRIGALRAFHEQLLLSLQLHRDDLIQLARVFLSNAGQFEHLYVDFCINYSKSIRTLQDAKKNRTALWTKLVICQQNLGHQLPVETYLLKPVQRVLKYQLLLQECVKHCMSAIHSMNSTGEAPARLERAVSSSNGLDQTHPCFDLRQYLNEAVPVLGQALERMIKVADHINEKKRCRELIDHLRTTRLDVDSWGELVLHGYFRVAGKKELRLVLLFHRAILLCKNTGAFQSNQYAFSSASGNADQLWFSSSVGHPNEFGSSSNSSLGTAGHSSNLTAVQIREVISCANLMLVECIPKDALAFHILPFDNPKAQRTLQAPTLEIKRLWCREIKRLILDNYDAAIPEKAKHIVLNMAELSTAQGLLAPSAVTCHKSDNVDGSGWDQALASQSFVSPPRTQTLGRASASEVNAFSIGSVYRSNTGHRKQRHSDTTVPDHVTLKQSSTCSLFGTQSSLPESPTTRPIPQSPVLKSTESPTDGGGDGLDAVFHDVWNKIWSKHTSSSNPTNGSTTSSNSQEQSSPSAQSTAKNSVLCDKDTDFRCIAVEINEERLGMEVPSEAKRLSSTDSSKPPSNAPSLSKFNGQTAERKSDLSRHHKAPAPRPPESSRTPLPPTTKNSKSPSRLRDRAQISSVYIDCPNASCYDLVTFGRAYEHYIAKARAQVALSPRDLDEIFSPLRELAQADLSSATIRAATVPLSGNVEVAELRQRMKSQRAATADRDPFFYRQTSPAQSNIPSIKSTVVLEAEDDDEGEASSHCSSGASSPRHLVSRIAVSVSRTNLANEKVTKAIVFQPPNSFPKPGVKSNSISTSPSAELSEQTFGNSKSYLNGTHPKITRTTTIHAGLLSPPRRQNVTPSISTLAIEEQTSGSSFQCATDSIGVLISQDVTGNGGLSGVKKSCALYKDTKPLIKNDTKTSNTPVNRSVSAKPRSLSTVNRTHIIELSNHLGLSRIRKSAGSSEPSSPPTERLYSPRFTRPADDSPASRGHRKSRAAPPPPSSATPVLKSMFALGSDRAPLAESEGAKDLDDIAPTVKSACRDRMQSTITPLVHTLPHTDDTISSTVPIPTEASSDPTSKLLKVQPAKPPRRLTLESVTSTKNGISDTSLTHPTNSNLPAYPNSRNSTTNGLSQTRSNTSFLRTGPQPRRGTVRTMIDRFQR